MATLESIESQLDRILALLDKPILAQLDKPKRQHKEYLSDYSPEFEELWQIYPKREGSNPKRTAFNAFNARIKAGETFSVMRDGVVAYRAYCDAKGETGGEYVMQAVRFFGPNQEYLQDWIAPAPKAKVPRTDAEWLEFGRSKGTEPRVGESWPGFIDRMRSML